MITLEQWMHLVDYKITDTSYYGWSCYGPNAYRFECWDGKQDGYSMEIIFDTKNHTTYELTVHDLKRSKAYRMLNKDSIDLYKEECVKRNVPFSEAWDDIEYTDLEVTNDFLEKAKAIIAGEDYDTRIQIELNLPKDELFALMKLAHEQDKTFNDFVAEVVEKCCNDKLNELDTAS